MSTYCLSSKHVTNNVVPLKVELTEEKDKVAKQPVEVKVHSSSKRARIWTECENSSSDEVTQ